MFNSTCIVLVQCFQSPKILVDIKGALDNIFKFNFGFIVQAIIYQLAKKKKKRYLWELITVIVLKYVNVVTDMHCVLCMSWNSPIEFFVGGIEFNSAVFTLRSLSSWLIHTQHILKAWFLRKFTCLNILAYTLYFVVKWKSWLKCQGQQNNWHTQAQLLQRF